MNTDTPDTDEQINGKPCTQFSIAAGDSLRDALVPSEFARQLERDRNDLRKRISRASEINHLISQNAQNNAKEALHYKKQRDALKEFVERTVFIWDHDLSMDDADIAEMKECLEKLKDYNHIAVS